MAPQSFAGEKMALTEDNAERLGQLGSIVRRSILHFNVKNKADVNSGKDNAEDENIDQQTHHIVNVLSRILF